MITNIFGETIRNGDFVYYSTKGSGPRIFLVREIIPGTHRDAAKVTTFARYRPYNQTIRRIEEEFVTVAKKSYVHYLQSAIPIRHFPPGTHPEILTLALEEQQKILNG